MELTHQLISLNKNRNENNMLARDSVSDEAADNENSQELQSEVEKFVLKFLEIPLFKSCNADEQKFHIGRKLCAYIFERIIFNGDDTIIHLCVKSNDRTIMERLLEILHKFKLDELLNLQNYNQETSVHLACEMNNVNVLQKMMEYGANVNVLDSNGNTALHVAIQNGKDDCVLTLLNTTLTVLDRKIDVDLSVFNDFGYTPLHLASMKNNLNVVEMLSDKATQKHCLSIFDDMDIKHGNNALHIAIQSNARDVAEYLIVNKCISPLKMNRSGNTALYLARSVNATHLVNLMEQHTTVIDEYFTQNDDDCDGSDSEEEEEEVSFKLRDTNKVRQLVGLTFEFHNINLGFKLNLYTLFTRNHQLKQ